MSKPRYGWWSYAKYMIRQYPSLKEEYRELQRQKVTREAGRVCGGSVGARVAENAALKQLPPAKQAEYDAVAKAIEKTKLLRTGEERLALIDMVFWRNSHTLDGAAYKLYLSYVTACRYHSDFIRLVGFCRGLADYEEAKEHICKKE